MARRRGRNIAGIVVLDKPAAMSSNGAVQKAKRLFSAQKVGHTGSLDPLATGVLPLCFGEATKFSQFLLTSDKTYLVRIKLGVCTDTGDSDGEILDTRSADSVTREQVESALASYRGEIDQIPSMFSAIKHNGQPLYKLARQGIEVERESRRIHVYRNDLVEFDGDEIVLDIHCSKGTYVRTIAQELGNDIGCGAHVIALRRTQAGPFGESDMVTFDDMAAAKESGCLDRVLQPISSAVRTWPEVRLSDNTAYYLRQGQPVLVPHAPTSGWVRLSQTLEDDSCRFLGVGEILNDGRVAPRRLVASA